MQNADNYYNFNAYLYTNSTSPQYIIVCVCVCVCVRACVRVCVCVSNTGGTYMDGMLRVVKKGQAVHMHQHCDWLDSPARPEFMYP